MKSRIQDTVSRTVKQQPTAGVHHLFASHVFGLCIAFLDGVFSMENQKS